MAVSFLEAVTFAAAGGDPQAINPATNPNAGDILILAQGLSDTISATASTLTSDSFGGTWTQEYNQPWASRRRLQVWVNDDWTTASGSVSVDFNHNQEEALGLLIVEGAASYTEDAVAGDSVGVDWTPTLTGGHDGHVVVIQMESTGTITGPAEWTKVRQVTAPNGLRSFVVFVIVGAPADLTPTFSWSGTNGFTGWSAFFDAAGPDPVTGTSAVTLTTFVPSASGTSVGSSSFTPAVLDGVSLRAWYDASDTATITGSPVSALADRSSVGLDLAQGTVGRRPGTGAVTLNGLNVLTFDGGDDLVAALAADWKFLHDGTAHLIVAVVKFGTGSNPMDAYGLCGTGAGSSSTIGSTVFFDDSGARNNAVAHIVARGVVGEGSIDNAVNEVCIPNVWNIVTLFVDPTNATSADRSKIVANGGLDGRNNVKTFGVSASNPSNPFALGSCGNFVLPMVGQFAEMVITDNPDDIDSLHPYLSNKWGLGRPYHLDLDGPVTVTAA